MFNSCRPSSFPATKILIISEISYFIQRNFSTINIPKIKNVNLIFYYIILLYFNFNSYFLFFFYLKIIWKIWRYWWIRQSPVQKSRIFIQFFSLIRIDPNKSYTDWSITVLKNLHFFIMFSIKKNDDVAINDDHVLYLIKLFTSQLHWLNHIRKCRFCMYY